MIMSQGLEADMNKFNEEEFTQICRKLGVQPHSREVAIRYASNNFFNKIKKSVEKDRRGEVVFCVIRPNGNIITVTCEEYPEGVFRIPTGGIRYGEDIINALLREVKEELGIDVEIKEFAGVLKIRFEHESESIMFYSYMFILKETGGNLLTDASDDEVSEVREVDITGLEQVVCTLDNITGKWSDWGKFRYQTSNAVFEHLKKKK